MSMDAAGYNGQISFDGQFVTITRRGFVARTTAGGGDKRFHVSQIGSIEWKPAGFGTRGFIHFAMPGSSSVRGRAAARSNLQTKDQDAVVFNRHQQPAFEAIRIAIEQAQGSTRRHSTTPPSTSAVPRKASGADAQARLTQLQELLHRGLISRDEFDAKRSDILREL